MSKPLRQNRSGGDYRSRERPPTGFIDPGDADRT
jgi:hypothetical protein